MRKTYRVFSIILTGLSFTASVPAICACTVPNIITNGQVADATKVMGDFSAVASCADAKSPAGSTNSVQINAGSGVLGAVGPLTTGQVLMGSTGAAPKAGTLIAGFGISVTNSANSITIASTSSGSGSGGSDITMALGAAWAKEMVVNGAAITAGTSRAVKADLGTYVGMRMIANTNSGFSGRAVSTVTYTVPAGDVAFVVHGQSSDSEIGDSGYYGARLFNVTKGTTALGPATDYTRVVASQPPGTSSSWRLQYSGLLSTTAGGASSDVNAYYPLAGVAGDVLQLEAWTNGDGAYRIQDLAVYLVIVNATTGNPIS